MTDRIDGIDEAAYQTGRRGGRSDDVQRKVDNILDEAYQLVCRRLEENGIKFDAGSTDCVFYDDVANKKTYCINLFAKECAVYEGE